MYTFTELLNKHAKLLVFLWILIKRQIKCNYRCFYLKTCCYLSVKGKTVLHLKKQLWNSKVLLVCTVLIVPYMYIYKKTLMWPSMSARRNYTCNVFCFLAHRSRRLEWVIVIAHRPPSVRPSVRPSSSSSVVRKLFTFSTSSPKPLDGFWWNFVGIKYSWSLTSVVVFRPDPPRGGYRAGQK